MLNVLRWSAEFVVIVWLGLTIAEAEGVVQVRQNMFKSPSNLLLTVPRRYFCYGSSVLHVMSVCIWYSAIWSIEFLFCFVI